MKNTFICFALLILLTGCNLQSGRNSNENQSQQQDDHYHLVWSDEFDYTGLPDSTKWGYDTEGNDYGWGNNEAQFYTIGNPENAKVENGKLHIVARKEEAGGKSYTSARIISKADWQFGKIEVNAKLPAGVGTWSAIWMMPGGWTFKDGNWPDVGEIDIMEHVGHNLGTIHASAHSKDYQWQAQTQKTNTVYYADVSEKFHSYIMEWDQNVMKVFVDDSLYFQYTNEGLGETKWPYNKPFYLILNVAVGGAWGGEQGIDEKAFPQTMEIDFVRVYQKETK